MGLTVWMLALLLAAAALVSHASRAAADFQFTYLDGLEQAVTRSYGDDDGGEGYISLELSASIARFATESNAGDAYDEVTWQYANGFASDDPEATPEAREVADLGDATSEFTSVTHYEILLEWYLDTTVLVTRAASDIYIVEATLQLAQEPQTHKASDLARAMMTSMLTTEAGAGEGVENPDGTFSGGLWDKLPASDHEALRPYEVAYSWDHQDFPEIPDPDEATPEVDEDEGLDFAALDGAIRAVGRDYSGDIGTSLTPESGETSIPYVAVLVAEFERDDQAAAALETIQDEALASVAGDDSIPMDESDAPELGDQARAHFGSAEEEGVQYELALVIVQDGPYVYLVSAVGAGGGDSGAGTMEMATALAEAMAASDAGDGDGTFDDAGGSTGGLWDKLPAAGDPVLNGLIGESDYLVYPSPDEGD
jgi:hypothetical protein